MFDYLTYNPAKRFNLPAGRIEEGGVADFAIISPDHMHTYTKEEILSRSKNSPFIGTELFGMNKMTIVNGKVKYKEF